jgi:hypothetical protein
VDGTLGSTAVLRKLTDDHPKRAPTKQVGARATATRTRTRLSGIFRSRSTHAPREEVQRDAEYPVPSRSLSHRKCHNGCDQPQRDDHRAGDAHLRAARSTPPLLWGRLCLGMGNPRRPTPPQTERPIDQRPGGSHVANPSGPVPPQTEHHVRSRVVSSLGQVPSPYFGTGSIPGIPIPARPPGNLRLCDLQANAPHQPFKLPRDTFSSRRGNSPVTLLGIHY